MAAYGSLGTGGVSLPSRAGRLRFMYTRMDSGLRTFDDDVAMAVVDELRL